MQYEPLDAGSVVQVIDWTSVALAIGAAGAVITIMVATWLIGFRFVKKLAIMTTQAAAPATNRFGYTLLEEMAQEKIRVEIQNRLREEYPPELVDDLRITNIDVAYHMEQSGGDVSGVMDYYEDLAQERLSS